MGSANTSEAVMNVLKSNTKPLNVDEIAFRTRTGRSIITEVLERLLKIKVVRQTELGYQLNQQQEYDLLRAFK